MKHFHYRYLSVLMIVIILALLFGFAWRGTHPLLAEEAQPNVSDSPGITKVMKAFEQDQLAPFRLAASAMITCVGGFAGSYPCNNVDLLAFMPLAAIGGGNGNDIWGWTDSLTGKEYALMGRTSGTSFVDISNPVNPIYLGNLPTHTVNSSWRDIKVYANHAFIVSEASGHGMQVFDLTQLRNVSSPPVTFSNTAHYSGFGNAHNLVINESSGYAYAVGTSTCSGGLHMVNIQNPTSPTNAGCFSSDGYTHDAQCVIYSGLDTTYLGREICFNSNEDTLTIVDVNNKATPVQLSRTGYVGRRYTHQGWLTEDQHYFLLDDELDEQNNGHNTRTYIWDVADLNAPVLIGNFTSAVSAIDHNQYIKGNYSYQANYRAGLRILDITNIASGSLSEVAYFDVYPSSNSPNFNGSWSNYPYFASGVVIVSGIEQGLFILQPNLGGGPTPTPTNTPTNTPVPPTPTNTPVPPTPTNTPIPPTPTNTPTNTPVPPTPTNTPVPPTPTNTPVADIIYASSTSNGSVGGVSFADEDILAFNTGSGIWSLYFDGSDVGLSSSSANVTALRLMDDGSILLSFVGATTIPNVGSVDDSDIVRFVPTSLGTNTAGTYQWYFDGSDVGLTTSGEDIDGVGLLADGRILLTTTGSFTVSGVSGNDEDILAFTPTQLGATTSGSWALYFDGSDVGLNNSSNEDVTGAWTDPVTGDLYLTTLGAYSVAGLSGDGDDIFICTPSSLGSTTACTFSLFWNGDANGFGSEVLDGIFIKRP